MTDNWHGIAGLAANLHGLRHFVRWKHPRVFASEHSQWEPPQVYEVWYHAGDGRAVLTGATCISIGADASLAYNCQVLARFVACCG